MAMMLPTKQVAINLNVDESTVRRIVRLFDTTSTVNKKEYPSEKAFRRKLLSQLSFLSFS